MEVQAPSPQTTLLILLGASAWPFMPEFQHSEAFANAARRLKAYFLNPRPFGLPAENLLDLFDSEKSADELDVVGQRMSENLVEAVVMVQDRAGVSRITRYRDPLRELELEEGARRQLHCGQERRLQRNVAGASSRSGSR